MKPSTGTCLIVAVNCLPAVCWRAGYYLLAWGMFVLVTPLVWGITQALYRARGYYPGGSSARSVIPARGAAVVETAGLSGGYVPPPAGPLRTPAEEDPAEAEEEWFWSYRDAPDPQKPWISGGYA